MTHSVESDIRTVFTPIKREDVPNAVREILLSAGLHDDGNARCVEELYKGRFVFCPAYGWLHYNGRHWDPTNAEAKLIRAVVDTLNKRWTLAYHADRPDMLKSLKPNRRRVMSCRDLFKSRVTVDVRRFDRSPALLNARNGVIDLGTGTLEPSRPDDFFTYCLPVGYDPDVDPAPWLTFLEDVLNDDQEMIEYLQ
jgi:putative DNA primase/helicase